MEKNKSAEKNKSVEKNKSADLERAQKSILRAKNRLKIFNKK